MKHSTERILTTHTGSLPRPAELVKLYARRANGEAVEDGALDAAGLAAMSAVVDKQLAAGIDIGNNGEQQREGFFLYVQRRMSGFGGSWKRFSRADIEQYPEFKAALEAQVGAKVAVSNFAPPRVTSAIRYLDPALAAAEAIEFKAALAARKDRFTEAFLTAPSPGIIAAACKNEFYDTEAAYLDALGEALRLEYEAIVANGFVLQIDCPDLALEGHVSFHDEPDSKYIGFIESVVGTINKAIRNIPRDRVRMHVCWGNYEGPHTCDIPLRKIWPAIRHTNVGGFVLPFANSRHAHEIKVLREMPLADDQVLVAGVIDVVSNFVEHPETVADRLERAAREIGDPTRVMGGTDCGFDSSAGMGRVASDVVWAKMRSLSEGARLASERLFK
ncbi:MAG TPA: epoxyalkane--coenzyme M transferase [Burkholderiales bacterium]|jgi:5-methyltetrahydropteroyltriglutamate--homocysteine methyltransferase|nr:epoxyalkane--coenzyme M transferase [Burkholderiales bacterium]